MALKKLVWGDQLPPSSNVVVARQPEWDKLPIDGMGVTGRHTHPTLGDTPVDTHMFTATPITTASLATAQAAYVTWLTATTKLTDNYFITTFTTPEVLNEPPIDWFDQIFNVDADNGFVNSTPIKNVGVIAKMLAEVNRLVAAAGGVGRFRGWRLDSEPSNKTNEWNPWLPSTRPFIVNGTKTIADYEERVYAVGKAFGIAYSEQAPGLDFTMTLGYEQMTKVTNPALTTDPYYLYQFFLDGLIDGIKNGCTVRDFYEDSYNRYLQLSFMTDKAVVAYGQATMADRSYDPKRVLHKDTAIFVDGAAGTPFTYFTYDQFRQAVKNGILYGVEDGGVWWGYSQTVALATVPPTISADYLASIYIGRDQADLAQSPKTENMPYVIQDLDPSMFQGIADGARVASFTDRAGRVYTERAASKGAVYKKNTINGNPALRFLAANLEGYKANGLAALVPAGTQDWGITTFDVLFPTAVGGATYALWSFGRAATTNPIYKLRLSSAPVYELQKADDIGSTVTPAGGTPTAAFHIITTRNNGIAMDIWVDNVLVATNVTSDIGNQTFDTYAHGYALSNSSGTPVENSYFGGDLGRSIKLLKALGTDEITAIYNQLKRQYGK